MKKYILRIWILLIGLLMGLSAFGQEVTSQNTYGNDRWIGHVYSDINVKSYVFRRIEFDLASYAGYLVRDEEFIDDFVGAETYFPVKTLSNLSYKVRTRTFSVSYKMNSTKKGCYRVNLRGDDGIRLYIDDDLVFSRWIFQSARDYDFILVNLNGNSQLRFEYFEYYGENVVSFGELVKLNKITSELEITQCPIGDIKTPITAEPLSEAGSSIGYSHKWQFKEASESEWLDVTGLNTETSCAISDVFNDTNVQKVFYFRRHVVFTQPAKWGADEKSYEDVSAVVKVIVPVVIKTNPIICLHT